MIDFFVANNLFKGKPGPNDHISSSGLGEIKRVLVGGAPFTGDEKYLIFGSAVHKRFLENKVSKLKLTHDEEQQISGMLTSLNKHKLVKSLMRNSTREVTEIKHLLGTNFKLIVDIDAGDIGADLKTTSAKSEQEFIKLALNKYSYLRQGWCYSMAKKFKEFIFIGIQKQPPYQVYILKQSDYEKEERKIVQETRFLIEFYKKYGRPLPKSS